MTTTYDAPIPYNSPIGYNGGPSVVTSSELPTWTLDVTRAIAPSAGVKSPLPEAIIEQMSFESSGPSAISFSVPDGSVGASLVGDYAIVELRANGQRVRDGRWFLRVQDWNAGVPTGIRKYTGKHLLWDRLERTVIQPGTRKLYASKSPGYILAELFTDAQNRDVGYWDSFTWDFTGQVDSNGQAWPSVLGSIEYLPNAKYSDIVANLVDKGLIDIHLLGNEIQVTVAKSAGTITNALLVVGNDLTDAPQKSSADNILTDVTVLGDDGVAVVRSSPEARAKYWREEGGISQGGTKDEGTLSIFGDVALSGGDAPRVQRTYGLVVTQDRPFLPVRDYGTDDWVRVQHGDGTKATSYLVKQIVLKQSKGTWAGTLVLNDKFLENDIQLAKKVAGIIGGATITGSAQTSTPDNLKDTGVPALMTGLAVSTQSYQNSEGITKVVAIASWNPVLLNSDGSTATDLATYNVAWWYTDQGVESRTHLIVDYPATSTTWGNLDPGREISVYAYAKDSSGKTGVKTAVVETVTQTDTTAPPQPVFPSLSSILRMFIVEWTGLSATGAAMPADTKHVEVWSSLVNDFDVNSDKAKLQGTISGAGSLYITASLYDVGATVYFKFVAVDNSGNRSPASAQNWRPLVGVGGGDIMVGSIVTDHISAGAIVAQHISAGAIQADKISVGQTANLVPDPSFNNADWRAKRKTTTWSDKPERWFFNNWSGRARNGYYLQALSTADGVNGGRMYITDWIGCMLGESYYVGMYLSDGEFAPNTSASMVLGVEVTHADGTVESDGISYNPFSTWVKYGYRFLIQNPAWVKVRFFIRADDLTAGDIIIDDLEVRSGVGTTATSGSRGLLDALGLFSWDFQDRQTFSLDFRTGDFIANGSIQSGFEGKRTVINPGATYLPEIRFYPQSGDKFAYVNASDNGTYPFIGVNAPDTGPASYAMVLYDNQFILGEIDKVSAIMTGGGMTVYGAGANSLMYLNGRMVANPGDVNAFMYGSVFSVAAGTTSLAIAKIGVPSAGSFVPMYSLARATGLVFRHHISSNINASWTCIFESGTVATVVHELTYRS